MQSLEGSVRRKRLLLVVSSYQPAMLADMQRARMLTWELPRMGWDIEVLTPAWHEVRQDVFEPDAEGFFSQVVLVHEVGSFARQAFEFLGSRSPAWRILWPLNQRGRVLLESGRFDLVYFSTTTFSYFLLGTLWQRKFGVPYILDFHDPWVKEKGPAVQPQSLKSRLAEWLFVRMERLAVANAAGLVAVSPIYIEALRRRYEAWNPAWLTPVRHAVIPFGALDHDLAEAAKTAKVAEEGSSGRLLIHYVGAGGSIMFRSFALICRALALLRSQGNPFVDVVRIRLFGTTYNWKPGDPKPLNEVAQDTGVGDLVAESPERVSYRRSLELLLEGDGVLILGVDDAGYMPSKLFSYALSGKPLLAALHRDSPAFAQFQNTPGLGHVLWFDQSGEMQLSEAVQIVYAFLQEAAARRTFDRHAILEPFLAPAMARRHAELFEACLEPKG